MTANDHRPPAAAILVVPLIVAVVLTLLPEPVGGLGQLLPPGAGANLLRSTGFFDGAGSAEHIAVLAAWALAGLAAWALAGLAAVVLTDLRGRLRLSAATRRSTRPAES